MITVLAATFGHEGFLRKMLDSIPEDVQVIVGDNSTNQNGMEQICKEYGREFYGNPEWDGICWVYKEIVPKAEGDLLFFTDGDVWFHDGFFKEIEMGYRIHKPCLLQPHVIRPRNPDIGTKEGEFSWVDGVSGKFLVSKEIMEKEGFFWDYNKYPGIGYHCDEDFAQQWEGRGYKLINYPKAVLTHYTGHTGVKG